VFFDDLSKYLDFFEADDEVWNSDGKTRGGVHFLAHAAIVG
jgi:hypothetical protein